VSGRSDDERPGPRERVEQGPWDLEEFDPDTHEEPPEDLEMEEPSEGNAHP
jgi:hypothetical protein